MRYSRSLRAAESDEALHLFEKLFNHHLGHAVQHALADARDQSADLGIRAVLEQGLSVAFFQIDRHVPLHEAGPARPFSAENVVRRRPFVFDRYFSLIVPFDRRDADLHVGFVLIRRHFVHALAARDALRDDLGIEQDLPNPVPRRVERVSSVNFQEEPPIL